MKLKHLNIQDKTFKANGKNYQIETGDISIERWSKYEEFTLELQYGVSQTEMFQNWMKVTQLANELKFTDIAVLANNMQNGLMNVFDRQIVALKICALFINEEKENRGIISDDIINNKINDWSEEGFSIGPFFQLALGFSRLINQISSTLTPESLAVIEKLNQTGITKSDI
ncbi:hypothetical protein SMI01S_11640 [Sphingobacterium mizutaii NBRC 14946 = DSM 11724]|uniref:Uncharacterized protein n=2 Tax=Sphingobacterium mizutaii TaxID=1010 RepID=A0AAJ5C0S8_9SPHI|nr:hypothetical protein [Sphingobacterium mizutaii]GEM67558.1 hypothetical protein SMI01S_11640 [Sphingobacterium mizutaii NBRC 14946 = DSM 11724]SDL14201.1 hypothetical protein SAMN05192578_1011498 [Sphingobacterium mizutaii]SNV52091.1 Uncharacterised protein [Sphingobacterium mizutaii]